MKVHELKTIPPYFGMVVAGRKHFEFRKNDRDFRIGDIILLKEYYEGVYSGEWDFVEITEIVQGRTLGIPEGYVIMEIRRVRFILSP